MQIDICSPHSIMHPIKTNAFMTAKYLAKAGHNVRWFEPARSPLNRRAREDNLQERYPHFSIFPARYNALPGSRRVRWVQLANESWARASRRTHVKSDATICYTPSDLQSVPRQAFRVFHLVDWPGGWAGTPSSCPELLSAARVSQLVLTSCEPLQSFFEKYGIKSALFENCFDTSTFQSYLAPPSTSVGYALYAGAINKSKLNIEVVRMIAKALDQVPLLVAGPPEDDVLEAALRSIPGVIRAPRAHTQVEVRDLLRGSRLVVIPTTASIARDYSFPLKMLEAVAAGRPVATTGYVPSWMNSGCVKLGEPSEWSLNDYRSAVSAALAVPIDELQRISRRAFAVNTYKQRTNRLTELLTSTPGYSPGQFTGNII